MYYVAAFSVCCVAAFASECRYLPGDSCWPTEEEWNSLNASVDGNLIRTVPIASVCHDPQYDEAACAALQTVWQNDKTQWVPPGYTCSAL